MYPAAGAGREADLQGAAEVSDLANLVSERVEAR